ncbi:phage portal protein [Paracidovorax wautersii]|uniref:HK97 family phage portal protein n=1 Tax=Paracidovorax wautersii TaxID=1177982 RepID=A0ABU1IIC2_9BURK|nr:phage portal protein [Paracidovorax wautersii]MDR6216178.1 HK97 family phage portal protein [Paracidovorax wautersii]
MGFIRNLVSRGATAPSGGGDVEKGIVTAQPRGLVSPHTDGVWHDITPAQPPGYFQMDINVRPETVLSFPAVFACVSLIYNDIGKLRTRLMQQQASGIWTESANPAYSPVLRRPNHYQNQIQFKQWWICSKLTWGNTYALKIRDGRGVVVALYILDPGLVQPLIAPDGSIFYQLGQDNLSGLKDATVFVPASEIIHDRMNCMFHPLVGVSPLFAASLPASGGLEMLRDSRRFFNQGAKPSGLLVAPGEIADEDAKRLQTYWNDNFTGPNSGKVAVVGDNLKYEPIRMTASDAQTKEQITLTSEMVAQVFHVPAFKVGGPIPAGQKVGDLNQIYFNDALHSLIEEMELCLDDGLSLPLGYRTELELENLLRMDPATNAEVIVKLVGGGVKTPNEGRRELNLAPLLGGDTVYMQQQDMPLDQVRLNRVALVDAPAPPKAANDPQTGDESLNEEEIKALGSALLFKRLHA